MSTRITPLTPIFESEKKAGAVIVGRTPPTDLSPALLADVNWVTEGSIPGDWAASFANSQVDGSGYYTSGGTATVTKTLASTVTTGVTFIGEVSGWTVGGSLQGGAMYAANSASGGSQNFTEMRIRTDALNALTIAYDENADDVFTTASRSGDLAYLVGTFDPSTKTVFVAVYDTSVVLQDSDSNVDLALAGFDGYDELRLDAWRPSGGAGTYRWARTAWYDRPMTQAQYEAVLATWGVI